ncbi:LOW QUALITY PROTEIN: hypothetical protein Tsubulata_044210 [Turnera subulata]|uniref:Uncharacterized protein n=1 Tax=Turnera subulata TaxID=218843 RepID=A0A9Q0FII4_9ROSI|nr:LOW QUALITY PROTEIN: hypothetical protein Tsubulata_044210 [Turnera subulata]
MSKPSQRTIYGLIRLHYTARYVSTPKPTSPIAPFLAPRPGTSSSFFTRPYTDGYSSKFAPLNPHIIANPPKAATLHLGLSQLASTSKPSSPFLLRRLFSSFKGSTPPVLGKGVDGAKKVLEKPVTLVSSAFSKYREAVGLQVEAFWRRNYLFLFGAGGVLVVALLWRIMFGIASTFVGLSEGMAKYGFLALSAAMGLYVRSRFTINPDKVYRMAMTKLNTSAGILEVMGAPLAGTEIRAYVMRQAHNEEVQACISEQALFSHLIKKGVAPHDMKLLAVDIPMASGPDQRLFLIGDENEYKVGGGLISELRDPVVKAMAAIKEFDDLDQIEEEEDEERERLEAEQKEREEIEKLEKGGS